MAAAKADGKRIFTNFKERIRNGKGYRSGACQVLRRPHEALAGVGLVVQLGLPRRAWSVLCGASLLRLAAWPDLQLGLGQTKNSVWSSDAVFYCPVILELGRLEQFLFHAKKLFDRTVLVALELAYPYDLTSIRRPK